MKGSIAPLGYSVPMLTASSKLKIVTPIFHIVFYTAASMYAGSEVYRFVCRLGDVEDEVKALKVDIAAIKNELAKTDKVKKN